MSVDRAGVSAVVLGAALFAGFGTWAFLKPPLQAPDEVTHLVRALGVPRQPWLAPGESVTVPAPLLTPFADPHPPAPLIPLYRQRHQQLDAAGIDTLEALRHPDGDALEQQRLTHAWSYPAPYYLAVFALGHLTTTVFGLAPYASFFVWRLASVAVAVPLWMWVWRRLGQSADFAAWRGALFGVLVLNPMVAFLTSSISPDAVLVPLSALTLIALYELAARGTRLPSALAIFTATALAKPAGLLLLLVSTTVVVTMRLTRIWRPLFATRSLAALVGAMACASAVHYVWTPPRTYGHVVAGTSEVGILRWAWRVWQSYWGMPGYLDYWLPWGWYVAVLVVVVAGGALAVARQWRRWPLVDAPLFAAAVALCFAIVVVGGALVGLPNLRYNVQGRYLLPVALGLAVSVVHDRARLAWASVAVVAAFHLALAHESVVRYFGDYERFLYSLPWR